MGVKDLTRPHYRSKARPCGPLASTSHLHLLNEPSRGALSGEIAKALSTFASTATRDLANRWKTGLAININGHWHCLSKLVAVRLRSNEDELDKKQCSKARRRDSLCMDDNTANPTISLNISAAQNNGIDQVLNCYEFPNNPSAGRDRGRYHFLY